MVAPPVTRQPVLLRYVTLAQDRFWISYLSPRDIQTKWLFCAKVLNMSTTFKYIYNVTVYLILTSYITAHLVRFNAR